MKKSFSFLALDIFYICIMIVPIVAGIIFYALTSPLSEGIDIRGAVIYLRIPMPVQDLLITEAQTNSWLVMITILGICLFLTHGLKTKNILIRQIVAEWIVEKTELLVTNSMGEHFKNFVPFIAAVLGLSAFSSLLSLVGLYPPTSDLNVVGGWAVLVLVLITYYKTKAGFVPYIKSFAEPVLLAPLNIISEIATPISMAFRHYGNILSGSVISVLVAAGLQGLSRLVLGWLPGILGKIPLFQIGIPAILSVYFDIFSGLLQAYIFAMLTMMYVSGGFPIEEYMKKKQKNQEVK